MGVHRGQGGVLAPPRPAVGLQCAVNHGQSHVRHGHLGGEGGRERGGGERGGGGSNPIQLGVELCMRVYLSRYTLMRR